jgi:hypothetical protein
MHKMIRYAKKSVTYVNSFNDAERINEIWVLDEDNCLPLSLFQEKCITFVG